ncbi:hypothetical protein Ahy_B05g076359 [Arachis hypogaea]|uniref:PB1-like domain-containing protein n=1 Tax=Arachis hypogaea TaxID=3818 RepID=A0A444Z345_ARAHY|nr:hypothetical protein Ahy_B05g076359 [Arachis hypogaea]
MALFNMRVHHGGVFGYENGVLRYLKGRSTVVEDIDGDRWSVFEAYEELRQLGYLKSTIAALWYKDPTADDYESQLKLLIGDTDAIEMCTIAAKRGFVDLFVVHEVGNVEGFPEVDFLDVGGETVGGESEGPLRDGLDLVVFEGNVQKSDGAGVAAEAECQNKDGGVELGQEGHEADNESDTKENSVEDIHFTDSDEIYDYESGFGEDNVVPKDSSAGKDKKVVTSDLDDDDAVDSDELEQDHVIGGQESGADDGEEAAEGEGQRFSVHKSQKDMEKYQWKVGTLSHSDSEGNSITRFWSTNLPTSQPRKTPLPRSKKNAARPTTQAPQPKKASTQPNIMPPKKKVASAATFTSNKQPFSQPTVRKRQFSVLQTSAPHVPLQKLRLMAKLPPSQWGNL